MSWRSNRVSFFFKGPSLLFSGQMAYPFGFDLLEKNSIEDLSV